MKKPPKKSPRASKKGAIAPMWCVMILSLGQRSKKPENTMRAMAALVS